MNANPATTIEPCADAHRVKLPPDMLPHKNQPFPARLGFALAGLIAAIRSERSLQFQVAALVAVAAVLAVLRVEPLWWAIVGLSAFAVVSAELFNTAVEHLADHLHPEIHPHVRLVKDIAAAAVLMSVCGAIAVALALVFHLLARLQL
jgi:undecaprenol kinase